MSKPKTYLRAVEPLTEYAAQLLLDAAGQAADGKDAVLQHRLEGLAKIVNAELKTVRAAINPQPRRAGR
jgi:hypothetical protein